MRIAFFGGTFDPPHRGHVAIATAAADRLSLDRVLVAPVGRQPLKDGWSLASYTDRLAMVELAFAADSRCEVSRLDAPLPDEAFNYSYETLVRLRHLVDKMQPASQLFSLLGADSFLSIARWHRASELMLLCDWIIAGRPGYALDPSDSNLAHHLPAGVRVADKTHEPDLEQIHLESTTNPQSQSTLYLMTELEEDVSATALRHALAAGDAAASDRMLAPAVARYIRRHGLYQAAG